MANLKAGFRFSPRLQVRLDVLNLIDQQASDIKCWGGLYPRSEVLGGSCDGGSKAS